MHMTNIVRLDRASIECVTDQDKTQNELFCCFDCVVTSYSI